MAIAKTATATRPAARPATGPRPAARPAATAASQQQQRVSLTEFSTGLLDDVDVEMTDVATVETDLNGKAPLGPYLAIEFKNDSMTEGHVEYYGCGKLEEWKPTDDGTGFYSPSGKTRISNQSNTGLLLQSLFDHGFPKDDANLQAGNVRDALLGMKVHVLRKKIERAGLLNRPGQQPGDREKPGTLLVSNIIQLPAGAGEGRSAAAVGGKVNGQAKAAAAPAAEPEGAGEELDEVTTNIGTAIQLALAERENGEIAKKDIPKIVMAYCKETLELGPKATNDYVNACGKQPTLQALAGAGYFEYTGSSVKAVAEA